MADREHTSTHYNQLLGTLKQKLLLMSYEAEQMISDCIRSLVDRRPSLAEQVIHRDDVVDKLEIEIDDLGYEILCAGATSGMRSPVYRDLSEDRQGYRENR